jgi:CheY-like chemotaxis protein
MRKMAKGILAKLGYDVVFAEDGEQTVNVFRERCGEIRAVLLDMAMPKKSGREAYIEMKKIQPEVKVILISGFKKDKRIEEILGLGVNAFIQKPYSMVTLAQEVKKVITG